MKRTKIDKSKLHLNAETLRLLTPENLEQIAGGRCVGTKTSTFNDGLCTEGCNTEDTYCLLDTSPQGGCVVTKYC